jgi:CO/xanthine dehydrogenase Mo-binding subunit
MGDSNYPPTDGSGGSWGAATSGAAVLTACQKRKAGLNSGMTEAEAQSRPPSSEKTIRMLIEENIVDQRYGSFVNQDLASYHVAVNADIGELYAVFLHEDHPPRQQGPRRARYLRRRRCRH